MSPKMEKALLDKRVRAIAELFVKAGEGKITEEECSRSFDRLREGMPPSTMLRVMSLMRQMTGDTDGQSMMIGQDKDGSFVFAEEPLQWDAPSIPAYSAKPPTDDDAGGNSAP